MLLQPTQTIHSTREFMVNKSHKAYNYATAIHRLTKAIQQFSYWSEDWKKKKNDPIIFIFLFFKNPNPHHCCNSQHWQRIPNQTYTSLQYTPAGLNGILTFLAIFIALSSTAHCKNNTVWVISTKGGWRKSEPLNSHTLHKRQKVVIFTFRGFA